MKYEVVICTYNGCDYIKEQVLSILSQSVKPERIIISDDGSTDNTIEILDEISQHSTIPFLITKGPGLGTIRNFISGLKFCKHEVTFFSDQDDIWLENKAELMLDVMRKIKGKALIYSDAILINESGDVITSSHISHLHISPNLTKDDSILFQNCVQGASSCINHQLREFIIYILDYCELSNIVMHDWFFAIIAKYSGDVIYVDKPMFKYRIHSKNEVGLNKKSFVSLFLYIYKIKKYYAQILMCSDISLEGTDKKLFNIDKIFNNSNYVSIRRKAIFWLISKFFY